MHSNGSNTPPIPQLSLPDDSSLFASPLDQQKPTVSLPSAATTATAIQVTLPPNLILPPPKPFDGDDEPFSPLESSSSSSSPASDSSEAPSEESQSSAEQPPPPFVMTPLLLAIAQDPSPRLSIQDAEEDESAHVQYITETYPVDQTIPDHFKLEPVRVEKGDRVAVIQELPNFTFRVKVLKDGQEGLLPAWALEEPQERLARINMEFNEAATCPREEEAKSTKSSSHASHPHKCLHAHGSCPEQTPEARRAFVMQQRAQTVTTARQSASSFASGSSSSSEESVLRMPELALLSPSARVKKPRNKKVKIVQFRDAKQGELYRYVLPASFNKKESRYLRSFLGEDLEATAKAEEIKKQEEEDETIYFDSWTESWNAPGVVLDMYPLRSLDELKSRPPGSKSDRFLQRVGQGLSDLEFRSGRLGAKVLRGAVALHSRVIQP